VKPGAVLATTIPDYPATRLLEPGDKPLFDDLFSRLQPRISEFTFANLYLFRRAHAYRLSMVDDALVLFGSGYGGDAYFLPPLTGSVGSVLSRLFGDGFLLYGADERFRDAYLQGEGIEVQEDRDSFDYLYLRTDLAELTGNRFHKKKNRINYFTRRHTFDIAAYTRDERDSCLRLLDEWLRVRGELESRSLLLEVEATREALDCADELGLSGLVVRVEGEVKAFVFGERLNHETSVCHFQKADPFLEGLSQLIDREFNRRLFTDCIYINREQDLGEQGLRSAKLSYHPVSLVRKYRAWQHR
jgi:uncharacterized protein